MIDRKKVINGLKKCSMEGVDCKHCPYDGEGTQLYSCETVMEREALALLKEQEKQIKNRDESLEKAREEIKWLRGMLKEQEAVEGTIEETRGEWPDETLPVSRNKEREYPCDHSRRNKA